MYAKIFASLYQGTLRGRAHEILVFTNLLANCDRDGYVDRHFRSISEEVGLSIAEVTAAIENLEAPDPESRSPELDGARIERIDSHRIWGWRVVNHAKYRAIRDEEDRREQNRAAQDRFRNRQKDAGSKVSPRKPSVSDVSPCRGRGRGNMQDTEAKEGAQVPEPKPDSPWVVAFGLEIPEKFRDEKTLESVKLWMKYKAEKRDSYKETGLKVAMDWWSNDMSADEFRESVQISIANGWKGLFKPNTKGTNGSHKPNGTPPWKQEELLKEQVLSHPANFESRSFDRSKVTPELKAELADLKTKLAEVRKLQMQ